MPEIKTASEIETIAKQNSRSMRLVCSLAGVAQSTFTRWKNGSTPSIETYQRLLFAAETGKHHSQMDGANAT
jgi:transcriptional regulator with XRE-family HTH domain